MLQYIFLSQTYPSTYITWVIQVLTHCCQDKQPGWLNDIFPCKNQDMSLSTIEPTTVAWSVYKYAYFLQPLDKIFVQGIYFVAFLHGNISLSHPGLGWLYVFSSFPPRPRPPPQKLFPLTSKPFELNLWYLAQRIYGSGETYWMTFPWPCPKVTAVASISKNLFLCAIKWRIAHQITTRRDSEYPWVQARTKELWLVVVSAHTN